VDSKTRIENFIKAGFAGFFLIFITACGGSKSSRIDQKSAIQNSELQNPFFDRVPKIRLPPERGIFTLGEDTIFTKTHYLGDTIEAVYYFTVIKEPLKILQVHPGCQCTAPIYPKDSIRPGQIDSIVLILYSKKVHIGRFSKSAYVLNAIKEVDYYIIGELIVLPEGIKPKKVRYRNR